MYFFHNPANWSILSKCREGFAVGCMVRLIAMLSTLKKEGWESGADSSDHTEIPRCSSSPLTELPRPGTGASLWPALQLSSSCSPKEQGTCCR